MHGPQAVYHRGKIASMIFCCLIAFFFHFRYNYLLRHNLNTVILIEGLKCNLSSILLLQYLISVVYTSVLSTNSSAYLF